MSEPLLEVRDLSVAFETDRGTLQAVDGVDFSLDAGETLGLVGETGSGKTVACRALSRLVPEPPGAVEGSVRFDGDDLLELAAGDLRTIRGRRIAYIFQNPQNALDPMYTVGEQIVEAITLHEDVTESRARDRAMKLLDRVGIPSPADRFDEYPHTFSGGMKQRVALAVALAPEPDILVADEPTTAVDVTIQSDLLSLLSDLQTEENLAIIFVTHDLGVAARVADRVLVLYAGKVMEHGDLFDIYERPAHPYTQALLRSVPGSEGPTSPIEGSLPDPTDPPDGCRFHPRCEYATESCRTGEQPPMYPIGTGSHVASCVFYGEPHDRPDDAPMEWMSDG
ncbi:MAG: ABC transporter ATP-binding protein [Halodesulfurarchaeum sp.]